MDPSQYGPFANVVALASALVAVFGVLLFKMLGKVSRWTWLTPNTPVFLVAGGARIAAVALMAMTYIYISPSNYFWFSYGALLSGVLGIICVMRFDYLRRIHVAPIPLVGADGKQLKDRHGKLLTENVVIGSEKQLRSEASSALKKARKNATGMSVVNFMSGYGSPVNDPEALWEREVLSKIGNRLTKYLMWIVLLAVMTVFLAAFPIEVRMKVAH